MERTQIPFHGHLDAAILERIEVKPPYFALSDLCACEGGLRATVKAEQPLYQELGPITGAEIGRHLAIIGSCALAVANPKPGRHFYLAQGATFNAPGTIYTLSPGSPLVATARAASVSGREGDAHTELHLPDGRLLCVLDTRYRIMGEKMFGRLFAGHHTPTPEPTADAYRRETPFPSYEIGNQRLRAIVPPVRSDDCAGHFHDYPCVPVAVLMGWLTRAAGKLLGHMVEQPDIGFIVLQAQVEAERLAFANQPIVLDVCHLEEAHGEFLLDCRASDAADETFGSMQLRVRTGVKVSA